MILTHPDAPFSVEIDGVDPSAEQRTFRVTPTEVSPAAAGRAYHVRARAHSSYLDLFERVARDFGTRSPGGRFELDARANVPLRPVLTTNVSQDVLYGYGDPAALRVVTAGTPEYFVVVTSNDAPQACPILQSPDLRSWSLRGFVFPRGSHPAWTAPVDEGGEFWAPELHSIAGRFIVCFAARQLGGEFAIGLATSGDPLGPYIARDEPLVRGGAIDPNMFVDDDGTVILSWKQDDNDVWPGALGELLYDDPSLIARLFPDATDARTAFFAAILSRWTRTLQPMERFFVQQVFIATAVSRYAQVRAALERARVTATGGRRSLLEAIIDAMETRIFAQRLDLASGTLYGERHIVLANDLPWEGHLVEGPWLTKRHGRYYLLYSGNDFSTSQYGVGVAVADSVFGPYAKSARPFVQSTSQWWGPGHPSVADAPDGTPTMFLHGYHPGAAGYKEFRALLSLPLRFTQDGIEPA